VKNLKDGPDRGRTKGQGLMCECKVENIERDEEQPLRKIKREESLLDQSRFLRLVSERRRKRKASGIVGQKTESRRG